nr:hypothetical protein GCM10017745_03250 [Saccharothrix mutabilis subsp. capreolus]
MSFFTYKPSYRLTEPHESLTIGQVELSSVYGARFGENRSNRPRRYSEVIFVRVLWHVLQRPDRQWKTSDFTYELQCARRTIQEIFDDLTAVGHLNKTFVGVRRDNSPTMALYQLTETAQDAYRGLPTTDGTRQ